MKIKLKKMSIENFGKFIGKKKEIEFGRRTKISGRNESGKTTIGDAYSWTLTNKLMNGAAADGIRPQENGKDIDHIDIVVDAELDIDRRNVEIRKTQSQEWVKKTGAFKGNNNTYMVNGIPKKEKEFGEFLSNEIVPAEALPFCTSASVLLKLDTKKRREKLFGLIPQFSDEDVIASDQKFEPVRPMLKDGTIDELISRAKFQLNGRGRGDKGLKGQLDDIPTRIDEASKQTCDVAEFELAIKGLDEHLADVDKQERALDESAKAYDDLSTKIRDLKEKKRKIEAEGSVFLVKKRDLVEYQIREFETRKREFSNDLRMAEMDLRHAEMGIQRHEATLKKAQEDYSVCVKREFDETKLHEIEAEQFDENSLSCPTCKQMRPSGQQEELRDRFEKNKADRIKEQQDAEKRFDSKTNEMLDEITERGSAADEALKESKSAKAEADHKISEIKKKIAFVSVEIEKLSGELEKIPKEVDMSGNEEYQNLSVKIAEKEKALTSLDNGSDRRAELRRKRNELISEKSSYQQKIVASQKVQDRVDKLREQRKEIAQRIADCEKELDLLQEFNRAKCRMLTAEVNKLFRFTEWQLFKQQVNGEMAEICEPSFKGISYDRRLNDGARLLIEADICATFQKAYDVSMPIWIDNSEALSSDTKKLFDDFEQQIIFLEVSDEDLEAKEIV